MGQSPNSKLVKKIKVLPSSQKAGRKRLVIGNVPRPGTQDFFLPMPDATDISGLFKEDRKQKRVHFIRSGVGVGKSTMARYLSVSDKFDNKFVIIEGTGGIECWKTWIIRAYKIEKSKQDAETPQSLEKIDLELASLEDEKKSIYLSAALDWFRDKHKVLIFDEAHKTFSQTELVSTLYHDPSINILLFSASSEVEGDQNKIVETPKEITEIYL